MRGSDNMEWRFPARQKEELPTKNGPVTTTPVQPVQIEAPSDPLSDLKFKIQSRLLQQVDLAKLSGRGRPELQEMVTQTIATLLRDEDAVLSRQERQRLISEIVDEVLGLGPLEPLLRDPTISEVMVNRPNQIYIERQGVLYLSDKSFRDESHIMHIIDRIISPLGRRVDAGRPMVAA